MQDDQIFEREALQQLPEVMSGLLDCPPDEIRLEREHTVIDRFRSDAILDVAGRGWIVEIRASSRPGIVASVAERFEQYPDDGTINLLVVPHMTPAGRETAAEHRLSWVDLSGNASIRDEDGSLFISVQGRPNRHKRRGRPSSPFAPKSARITRQMLIEPTRWWRQKELSEATGLDDGSVSRVARRLGEERLVERVEGKLRPRDPRLLLDAWEDEYRFDRHDVVSGHISGSGIELARNIAGSLRKRGIAHAFTGLAAAWLLQQFAQFRLVSVYIPGDPRAAAVALGLRSEERGANVQLIGPDDEGVFAGGREIDGLACVAPVQTYLDLNRLPERAREAAEELRRSGLWDGA